jgi:hypothetical protein
MPPLNQEGKGVMETGFRELPPLILHPFADQAGSDRFLEDAKATLMMSGLLPENGYTREELSERVLRARFLEIRMLYFLGKDLFRWIEQCVESVERDGNPADEGLHEQSFAQLLVRHPPQCVRDKLTGWGVTDYCAIFARALGLITAFRQPPQFEQLGREFILNYHRYADFLFACYQQLKPFTDLGPDRFRFELYGSGEYSRLLENQWEREP